MPASPDPRIERVGFGHPDAMHLIAEVQLEYVRRYGSVDETPLDPLMFELPHGSFFVGYVRDVPVMTGAWRRRGDVDALGTTNAAEIKRMYVVSGLRGHGLARLMLARLEETAAASGAEAMVLETGTESPEAIGLYTSSSYVRIEPFGFCAHEPITRCFAKSLARASGPRPAGSSPS